MCPGDGNWGWRGVDIALRYRTLSWIRSSNALSVLGDKVDPLRPGVQRLRSPLARMKVALELLRQGQGGEGRIADLEAEADAAPTARGRAAPARAASD